MQSKTDHPPGRTVGYVKTSPFDPDGAKQRLALLQAGVEPDHLYVDHAVGRKKIALGLQACLAALRAGDLVTVRSFDRLGRDIPEILSTVSTIHASGAAFQVLAPLPNTNDDDGEIVKNAILALAEMRSNLAKERAWDGQIVTRLRGGGGREKRVSDQQVRAALARIESGERMKTVADDLGISRQGLDKRIKRLAESTATGT